MPCLFIKNTPFYPPVQKILKELETAFDKTRSFNYFRKGF